MTLVSNTGCILVTHKTVTVRAEGNGSHAKKDALVYKKFWINKFREKSRVVEYYTLFMPTAGSVQSIFLCPDDVHIP